MRLLEFSSTPLSFKDVLGALQQRFGLARVGGQARVYTVGGLLGVVYLVHGGPKAVGLTWARGSKTVTGVYVWNHFNAAQSPDLVIDMPQDATTAFIPGIIDFIDSPHAGPITINENLSDADRNMLREIKSSGPLLRKFLDKQEITIANSLAKRGLVYGGTSDDKQASRQFSITAEGEDALEESVMEDAIPAPANDTLDTTPVAGTLQIMARNAAGTMFVVPGTEATARAIETRLAQQAGGESKTMEEQYDELRKKIELVVSGRSHNLKSLLIYGAPSSGKTFTVMQVIKAMGLKEGVDYVVKKGSITDFAAYRALIQNIDGLIIFDDCDSVVATKVGKNMIKGALDTYPVRDLSYDNANTIDTDSMPTEDRVIFVDAMSRVMRGTATADDLAHFERYEGKKKGGKEKAPMTVTINPDGSFDLPDPSDDLDLGGSNTDRMHELQDYFNRRLPNKIDYRGRMIFISNMGRDEWDSAILTRTFSQYMSFGNLEMLDFIERIKDTIAAPGLTTENKQEVIDWIRHLHGNDALTSPINFRLIQQGFDLFLTGPGWKSMIADL